MKKEVTVKMVCDIFSCGVILDKALSPEQVVEHLKGITGIDDAEEVKELYHHVLCSMVNNSKK